MASLRSFREALVTIANADATVVGVTGRPDHNMVVWGSIHQLENQGYGYKIVDSPQTGQNGEQRLVRVQFDCFGKNMDEAEALAGRLQDEGPTGMLIHANFFAEGVDAVPIVWEETDTDVTDIVTDGRKEMRVMAVGVFEVKIS